MATDHPLVWTLTLDLDDQSFPVAMVGEVRGLERGVLNAEACDGRSLELRFDRTSAFVVFWGTEKVLLRPHFPARRDVEPNLRQLFCPHCGILLCHRNELLQFGMTRGEGFRLVEAMLAGSELPCSIPEGNSAQPLLPGMEAYAEYEVAARAIEWRPFGPVEGEDDKPAEPRAAPDPAA